MPQLQFRFELSDYVNAQRLHGRRTPVLKCVQFFSRWIAPIMGVLMVVFAISRVVIHGLSESRTELPVSVFIILGVGIALIIYWPLVHLNWRLCYEETRSNDGEWSLEFSDDLIRTHTNNSKSEVRWSAIRSFAEDKNMFLLYLAPAKFFPLPKRACTPEEINDLRELFQRRVRPES